MRLRRTKGPTEPCETCGRLLVRSKRVEIVDTTPHPWGGSGMIATYCRKHAPKERSHAA